MIELAYTPLVDGVLTTMGYWMETRQMRLFVAIAEEGSLSAAAARIGVAQPSLSQMMKLLEEKLGVELIVRSPRGITLTDAGTTLLKHAREILEATDRGVEEVRLSGVKAVGPVAFGLPSSVSMVLSVPLAETVRLALPQVSLRVVEAMSGFIRDWMLDSSIDLGILYDVATLRHCHARLLMTEDLHFFSAPDAWPLATPPGEPVPLPLVAKEELVLPSPSHGLRSMIDRFAKDDALRLNVVLEMDALTQIKSLVARGSAYSILAPAAAHDSLAAGHLVSSRIVEPVMSRPVYLVHDRERRLTRASREVEQITIEVICDLVNRGIWTADLTEDLR